jgi:dTMP kinase
VYSAAKRNPLLPASWARAPEVGLPLPDVCFFLDIAADVAAARGGGYGEEKYETREMQRRVREEYGKLLPGERNVVRVDAGREREVVEEEMLGVFREAVRRLGEEPIELKRVGEMV